MTENPNTLNRPSGGLDTRVAPSRIVDYILDNAQDAKASEVVISAGERPRIIGMKNLSFVPGYRDVIDQARLKNDLARILPKIDDLGVYRRPGVAYRVETDGELMARFVRLNEVVPKTPKLDSLLTLISGSEQLWLKNGEYPSIHSNDVTEPIPGLPVIVGDDLDDELRAFLGGRVWSSFIISQLRSILVVYSKEQREAIMREQNPKFTHVLNGVAYELNLMREGNDTFLRAYIIDNFNNVEDDKL